MFLLRWLGKMGIQNHTQQLIVLDISIHMNFIYERSPFVKESICEEESICSQILVLMKAKYVYCIYRLNVGRKK